MHKKAFLSLTMRIWFRKLLCDNHRKSVCAVNFILIFTGNMMRCKWKVAFASQLPEALHFVAL